MHGHWGISPDDHAYKVHDQLTTASVTLTASNRFFVWVGVNMTAGSTTTNFAAELDVEGTLNGNFDSQVAIPNPIAPPAISGLTPGTAAVGASITIAGSNFGATQGTSTVKFFNNKTAAPTGWSATSITAPVPTGATTGALTVTVGGQVSNGVTFTVVAAPSISTVSPSSAAVGAPVTINGSGFGATQGTSTVKFNGTLATPTSWTATSIGVPVPVGATSGNIVVNASGVNSNGKAFTVLSSPTISGLNPSTGFPGTAVTISGSNFGATKGTSTVKFNGTTASTTAWGATSITATVPAGATTGNVVITVGGAPSAGVLFTVPALVSIDVAPHNLAIPIKGQQQYLAWGLYSDGITRNVTATATWASSDPSVATIGATGLTLVAAPQGSTTVSATIGAVGGTTGLTGAPSKFRSVSGVLTARQYHTATRLLDGKVLIVGGQDGSGNVTAAAELYDPVTGRFTATGSLLQPRHLHTASLLPDGMVLITGGVAYNPDVHYSTAEVYDPATGTFSFTSGFMSVPRFFHSATLLADGRVLIDGGDGASPPGQADIYDPISRTFSVTGAPSTIRYPHPEALLNDGRVLFPGAYSDIGASAAVEIYDPTTGTYSTVASLSAPRSNHTATRLSDGRVLVVGGNDVCPTACSSEVFDPVAQTFSVGAAMSVGRAAHTATLLDDGTVLVVGGQANATDTATAEFFDPATNTFVAAGGMAGTRWGHTATVLIDGTVLIVGGSGPLAPRGAELYIPTPVAPLSLSVTPSTSTMQPGDSRSFAAIDQLGHARSDAMWSVDNATAATVDPVTGVVSATAAGNVVLTASIGSITATAQIVVAPAGVLSMGTVRWSTGVSAGLTATKVVPGSGQGPALFSVNIGASETQLQALGPGGEQLWHSWLPGSAQGAVPNGSGGLLLTYFNGCDHANPIRLVNIDGATGMWAWEAVGGSTCPSDAPQLAVRHDGAVAVVTPGNLSGFPSLMLLDGKTGAILPVASVPQSTFTSVNGQQTLGYSRVGPSIVDVEGTVHLLFEKRFLSYPPQVVNTVSG